MSTATKWFFFFLMLQCSIFLLVIKKGKTKVGSLYIHTQGNPSNDLVPICAIAQANSEYISPITYNLSAMPKEHPSVHLCKRFKIPGKKLHKHKGEKTKSVIIFKTARVGSTAISHFICVCAKHQGLDISEHREPYGSRKCFQDQYISSTAEKEMQLKSMVSNNCPVKQSGGKFQVGRWYGRRTDKCTPKCPESNLRINYENGSKHPFSLLYLNPRFLSDINWQKVILLRRTNLVKMAFSAFYHGKCMIKGSDIEEDVNEAFLRCVEHFAILDQEYAASTVLSIFPDQSESRRMKLILYEDYLSLGNIMKVHVLDSLGMKHEEGEIKEYDTIKKSDKNKRKKIDYDRLKIKLGNRFPCLSAQLEDREGKTAWSMPMLANKTVSIHGSCHPLTPLRVDQETGKLHSRRIEELYSTKTYAEDLHR